MTSRRALKIPIFGIFAASLFSLVLLAFPARAETYLTVGDVHVDVTAKTAAAARDKAIADAQRIGFEKLMQQMLPNPADQARVKPSQEQIEGFVQDFAVENERVSAVRYLGVYSVRFRAGRIHKYLTDSGITATGDVSSIETAGSATPAAADDSAQPSPTGGGQTTSYAIAMPLGGIADWVQARNKLTGLPGVQRLSLDVLTRDAASFTLDFAGDPLALQAALAGTGFILVQTAPPSGFGQASFQLKRAGAQRPR